MVARAPNERKWRLILRSKWSGNRVKVKEIMESDVAVPLAREP